MRRSIPDVLLAIGLEQVKETSSERGHIMDKVKSSYKAVTAFVISLGAFLTTVLANPEISAALPEGVGKWLVVVGVPAVVGAGTWLKRNEPTLAEAEEALARARERAGV